MTRRGGAPGPHHGAVSERRLLSPETTTGPRSSAGRAQADREAAHDAHAAMLDRLARMLWQAKHGEAVA
jgi:hypothetical protein